MSGNFSKVTQLQRGELIQSPTPEFMISASHSTLLQMDACESESQASKNDCTTLE